MGASCTKGCSSIGRAVFDPQEEKPELRRIRGIVVDEFRRRKSEDTPAIMLSFATLKDVCDCLKSLQTSNKPFSDEEAWSVIADETMHPGPIAPGKLPPGCPQPDAKPLFAAMTDD